MSSRWLVPQRGGLGNQVAWGGVDRAAGRPPASGQGEAASRARKRSPFRLRAMSGWPSLAKAHPREISSPGAKSSTRWVRFALTSERGLCRRGIFPAQGVARRVKGAHPNVGCRAYPSLPPVCPAAPQPLALVPVPSAKV